MARRDTKEPIDTRPETQLETRPEPIRHHREAPKHRQCPRCYSGAQNGVGQCNGTYAKASTLTRRYYRCDGCGHTWIVDFKPEEVRDLAPDDEPVEANPPPVPGAALPLIP